MSVTTFPNITGQNSGAGINGSVVGATSGSIFFAGDGGVLSQNNSALFWDNANTFLKISSPGGETFRMTYRTATDGITPGANTNAGLLRLTDASSGATNGNTLSLGFYTLGSLIRFDGDYTGHGFQSSLEFWGVDNIAAAGAASPICTMVTSSTVHEVHCPRGNTDLDAIIHAYPPSGTPVIYTETGGNNILQFGVSRTTLHRITTSGANGAGNALLLSTAAATDQNIEHQFYDNGFTGTLKGRLLYAGSNGGGSKYFGLINTAADFLGFQSDTTIFYNSSGGTEYGRWMSTDFRPGTTNSFNLGDSTKTWKNFYFGTQAIGPAGSAGTPAYTFTGTTDGFYSRASGTVDISIGGNRVFEFDGANMYIVVNGSSYNLGVLNDVSMSRVAAGSLGIGGQSNGQKIAISTLTELTTIAAAATTDTAIQIPLDAVVFAVSVRVTVVIPTATTFTVTGTTSGTQFDVAGGVSTAANTTDVGTRNTPYKNGAAQTIRITPNINPAANSGRVRVTIHYYQITAATS